MKPKTVKRIFLFFIIYLPIQYALVGVIGLNNSEPWPAFVFPGFKSVFATEGNVEIDEARLFAVKDNDPHKRTEIAPSNLFEGLPASQLQGFLRSNFNKQKEFSDEAKQWMRDQLERLYPGQSFSSLNVEWGVVTYRQEGNSVSLNNRETTETFTISLDTE
ncbi:MAG: hypothetical protein GVY07_01920 [Bacteroidetes bacterium]|jgi:hypothetical protein|nr:hypothetical protein [Bacteroidota bacterium]